MEFHNYLNDNELESLYWDNVSVSYMNENYKKYTKMEDKESFPMSVAQLLSNALSYLQSPVFNSINNKTRFFNNYDNNIIYFNYF
jgi:hypothetical protein